MSRIHLKACFENTLYDKRIVSRYPPEDSNAQGNPQQEKHDGNHHSADYGKGETMH